VIGVAVRKDNRIQAIESNAQSLLSKIRCGVDHHVLPIAGKQQRGS